MQKVTPFLSFVGQAEEAARFYVSLLPDSRIDRITRSPDGGQEIACGWLKDRWGVTWQVTPARLMELVTGPDRERAARALASIGNMRKINIAEVERAADGT